MHLLKVPYFHLLGFEASNFSQVPLQPSCTHSRLKPYPLSNGGPTWPEDHFLSPFLQRRKEMANPVLTKSFLQLSPEAAMLPGPRVETRPPPSVPPFLLAQNLNPKDIAEVTSQGETCMMHNICVYCL